MWRTGVLVPLQHQLRQPGLGIPELYSTVLRSGDDPSAIGRNGNR